MTFDPASILRAHRLRDTQQRRDVLRALYALDGPATHAEIHAWIEKRNLGVNLVTVYRMLETFAQSGIVHRHPSSGCFVLCTLMSTPGHHGMLSCTKCGTVKEFASHALCKVEDQIARSSGFAPKHHVSEIVGVCSSCQ